MFSKKVLIKFVQITLFKNLTCLLKKIIQIHIVKKKINDFFNIY